MILSLKIKEIKEYNEYILQDMTTKKQYSLILEFHRLNNPKIGDVLLLDASLLNRNSKNFSQPYAFEKLDNEEKNIGENDLACLVCKDKKYILKRIYG